MNVGVFNRRTAARLVLLTWAGSLAWLARREFGKNEQQVLAEATIRLNPEAHFYTIKADDKQLGYASITVDTIAAGFRLSEVMALDVPEADSTRRVTRRTDIVLSRSLRLKTFVRTVSGGGLFEEFSGTVLDSAIRFRQRDNRDQPGVEWFVPVSGDVVLPQVLPYRLAFSQRLETGRSVIANVLDLTTGVVSPVNFTATAETTFVVPDSAVEQRATHRWIAVRADSIRAWRIEHATGGSPTVSWVDVRGGLVVSEAAFGIRLERSAFELVSFNYRDALLRRGPEGHRSIPAMQSLVEAGVRPSPGSPTTYEIRATPIERFLLPRLAWLAGGRQAALANAIRVGGTPRPAPGIGKSEFLDPAQALPPIDPTIRVAAGIVAGDEKDPMNTIRRLTSWVARVISVDTAHGAPELPTRVLAERKAGADGHAALLVSMARSRGIRARLVSGVAAIDRHVYGHAWTEVWVDGEWLAVDPTFGQVPASNQLLRVAVGGSSRAIDLVPLLGSAVLDQMAEQASR